MVHVWDLSTGEIVQKPKFGDDKIHSVAFDPTGKLLAAGSQKGSIAFFHAETGVLAGHIEGFVGRINALAFSPDGTRLVSGSSTGTATIWDTSNGRQIAALKDHKRAIFAVRYCGDGRRIYTASADKTALGWDIESGAILQRFAGHDHYIVALDISPDGRHLLTGSADKTMTLWDTETGKEVWSAEFNDWVKAVTFSPDGRFAATADGPLRIFNLAEQRVVARLGAKGISLAFTPDGRSLTTMNNRCVMVYSLDE